MTGVSEGGASEGKMCRKGSFWRFFASKGGQMLSNVKSEVGAIAVLETFQKFAPNKKMNPT